MTKPKLTKIDNDHDLIDEIQSRVDALLSYYREEKISPLEAANEFMIAISHIFAMQELTDEELDEMLPKMTDMVRLNFAAFQRMLTGIKRQ